MQVGYCPKSFDLLVSSYTNTLESDITARKICGPAAIRSNDPVNRLSAAGGPLVRGCDRCGKCDGVVRLICS
jgi:hypothetical protein